MTAFLAILMLVYWLLYGAWLAYMLCVGFARGVPRLAPLRRWTYRLRWILWTGYYGVWFLENTLQREPTWYVGLVAAMMWVLVKNDHYDDDFWKRNKAKVKEAVAVAGHKLVVVPAR